MKNLLKIGIILIGSLSFQDCQGQTSEKCLEIERKNGSNAAKKVMVSDFYYDPLDAWSPFGNDVGSDTYYIYCDWKKKHPDGDIKDFVDQELTNLGYSNFNILLDGSNMLVLSKIVDSMPNQFIGLNSIDNMLISLAFSQLFLEGRIQPEVMKWAEAAFSRELAYIDFWTDKVEREKRMTQILSDLRKAKT